MGTMMALPASNDFDQTGSIGGLSDVYPRESETLNYPSISDEVWTDVLDAEDGFVPAQSGRQDQLIGKMLFQSRA